MRVHCNHTATFTLVFFCWLGTPAVATQPAPQAQQYFQEGERALADGRYADAARAYEELRKLDPSSAEVHARLGMIYFQAGKFADAVPVLQRALKLKPSLSNAAALLAMCLSELGRYEEALPGLKTAFRQIPDPALKRMAGLHLMRANTFLERHVDAAQAAVELSRLYPKDPEVLYHTGRIFADLAYRQTMTLARVAPQSVWLHQAAGEANESEGAFDAAVQEYREVLTVDPHRPGIHYRTGRALLARSRQPDAARTPRPRRRRNSSSSCRSMPPMPMRRTSSASCSEKPIGSMRRSVSSAGAQHPIRPFEDALVGLGRTLVPRASPRRGLPHLEKAIAIDPHDEVAVYQLAQAHRALGQTSEMEKTLALFQQLRDEKQQREQAAIRAPSGVTRQEIDRQAPQ